MKFNEPKEVVSSSASGSSSSLTNKPSAVKKRGVPGTSTTDEDISFYFSSASNSDGEDGNSTTSASDTPPNEPSTPTLSSPKKPNQPQPNTTNTSTNTKLPSCSIVIGGVDCETTSSFVSPPSDHSDLRKCATLTNSINNTSHLTNPIQINKCKHLHGGGGGGSGVSLTHANSSSSLTYRLLQHKILNSSSLMPNGSGEFKVGSMTGSQTRLNDRSFSDILGRTFATGIYIYIYTI
jgi:hypothetical protein